MRFLEKVRGKIREMREEARRAKEAERKLKLAEEKEEAQKYIRKAKKVGIELTEEEALALVRKKKKGGVIERLQKAAEVADAFAKEFAGDIYQPKKSTKKSKSKNKPAIQEINDIGMEFADILGFGGKKRGGKDPFNFWDLL